MAEKADETLSVEEPEEPVDYEEDQEPEEAVEAKPAASQRGSYAGIHSCGFRDFILKAELLRAVTDCGFEHPSEVQQECIPQALLGMDIICQAKSGMGKTAVFVLACLQNLEMTGTVDTLVLCHTRELAYQICKEFNRFSRYLTDVDTKVFFGGVPVARHYAVLKEKTPNIVIGTPGRTCQLVKEKKLDLSHLKRFVLDECDELLGELKMRRDVQTIFRATPHEKHVMMFSATLPKEIRVVAKKFTQHAQEVFIDDESKLTLHGLQQYYVKLPEKGKNRKLIDLLDVLEFNQVVIFVNGVRRCKELNKLLLECNFPSVAMYGKIKQEERLTIYNNFKEFKSRILVSTDIFGRGVDFERVNIVINYDMPIGPDPYLHRVGRSGRFGTKGLAISFISDKESGTVLEQVQERFEVDIKTLPDTIDTSTYISS